MDAASSFSSSVGHRNNSDDDGDGDDGDGDDDDDDDDGDDDDDAAAQAEPDLTHSLSKSFHGNDFLFFMTDCDLKDSQSTGIVWDDHGTHWEAR